MNSSIAKIAKLIGDSSRASILTALMSGQALTAGELAGYANISAQTASNHLNKLLKAKLIKCEAFGRHRYYSLSHTDVAAILEKLSLLSPGKICTHNAVDAALKKARTCYDHLAGDLGVSLTDKFLQTRFLTLDNDSFHITPKGRKFFLSLNIDCDALQKQKRHFAKPCLDFTERRYHMAGSLANALLEYCLQQRLVIRSKKINRALIITSKGTLWFNRL